MKVGDRVRYTGSSRPDWLGIPATITYAGNTYEVKFDREWVDFGGSRGRTGTGIRPEHLELLTVIDKNKPLRFKDDPRIVTLVGVMPDGNLVVVSTYGSMPAEPWTSPLTFDKNTGKVLAEYGSVGSNLVLENAPVMSSAFYPLCQDGSTLDARGLTMLDIAKSDFSGFNFFLEVVTSDGVPTEAKIHAR